MPAAGAGGRRRSRADQLAEGVFANIVDPDSAAVANSGVIILEQGVLVFDTHFTPEAAQELRRKIARDFFSAGPVCNQQPFSRGPHARNQVFDATAHMVSSVNAHRDIVQRDIPRSTGRPLPHAASGEDAAGSGEAAGCRPIGFHPGADGGPAGAAPPDGQPENRGAADRV